MFFKNDDLKNFINFIGKHMCGYLFSAITGLQFLEKETPTQLFSSEFCEIFKNTLFTEHFRTTASGYRNNMPRGFKTKCKKNESSDILITYLYILMASTCDTQFIKQQHVKIKQSHINLTKSQCEDHNFL